MGQIIVPLDKKIDGPWLLDTAAFEQLHESLIIIEDKLEEAFKNVIERATESKLEEFQKWGKPVDIDKARKDVEKSLFFAKFEKYVLLLNKQGKKVKDDSIIALLKDSQINDFNPIEIQIKILKGPCEFTLEISTKNEGELTTRIKTQDDIIFNDINYEISKWIDKYKPNIILQKWSSWFPGAAILLFLLLIMMTGIFVKDKEDSYKIHLNQESRELLKDGLTQQEANRAIEILLQLESGYIPESFSFDTTNKRTMNIIWLIGAIVSIILVIKPRTVIGLGSSKWKVTFYKKWASFVLIFIPLSIILPIARSKFF